MLSLDSGIQPTAPGVRAPSPARRASHLSGAVEMPAVGNELPAVGNLKAGRSCRDFPVGRIYPDFPAWKPKNPRLARLAEKIRRLQQCGRMPAERCPSGLAELDAALGGGFLKNAVHEWVAAHEGAPAYSLALRVATEAAGSQKWIFFIDTQHDLYPPGVAQLGVPLERLIVVRVSATRDALWTCEQALRCRAIAAVVLPMRSVDPQVSRRLQLAAEAGESLGILICQEQHDGGTFAATRLRLEPRVGHVGTRRMAIAVLKQRAGAPSEPFVVEWPDAANFVPVSALSVDRAGTPRFGVGG